jgi:YVTN family beta-propeller protein
VTQLRNLCAKPAYFAAARDAVWITCVGPGLALRVDPRTNRVVARVRVGTQPGDGVVGADGTVWIPSKADGTLSRIDPATNAVVETVKVGSQPFVLNVGFGDLWVPDFGGREVWRVRT